MDDPSRTFPATEAQERTVSAGLAQLPAPHLLKYTGLWLAQIKARDGSLPDYRFYCLQWNHFQGHKKAANLKQLALCKRG
jgi:hypothetical protein